jgi:ureidoglycolate hydrolase
MTTMIGGLSLGMVNLVVILVILGAAFLVVIAAGFSRLMNGEPPALIREPSQEQIDYMRGVRYRTKVNLYHTAREILHNRNSRETNDMSSIA